MKIKVPDFDPVELVITPTEWPTDIITRLRNRHPILWRDDNNEEAAEDFLRHLLSALSIDFEAKQKVLSKLPLDHCMRANMLKQTIEEGQQTILGHLEDAPENTLHLASVNIISTFGLLDIWQIGFQPHEEQAIIRQIMAKKFINNPSTVNVVRNTPLDHFLVRETFQPLLDTAAIYEGCRQPSPMINQQEN